MSVPGLKAEGKTEMKPSQRKPTQRSQRWRKRRERKRKQKLEQATVVFPNSFKVNKKPRAKVTEKDGVKSLASVILILISDVDVDQ